MAANDLPLVSIITPSYNSGDFIEAAITSVLAQDYPNLEHLVIDGGSTDPTLEILKRYEPKLNWFSEPDQGQAEALNKGFRRARGEIIGWLNADDTYQPQAVSSAVKFLRENLTVSLVYGHFNFIDETGQIFHTHCIPPFSVERLLYGNIIPNTGMFFRRQVIDELGGVNPHLHFVLDWEFVLRVAQRYRVCQAPVVWGNFRITTGTKSVTRSDHFWPEIIPILEEITGPESRLSAYRVTALFWAHLLGALEFARTNDLKATKNHLAQAWPYRMPTEETPRLAFMLIETATRPWHRGFKEHPQAQQTITNFISCLGDLPIEQTLRAYLKFYQGLADLKGQNWRRSKTWLMESWPIVPKRGLLHPAMLRSLLYLLGGSSLILKVRTFKNRATLKLRTRSTCS